MKEIAFFDFTHFIKLESSQFINIIIENKTKLFDIEQHIKLLFQTKERYFSLLVDKNPVDIEDNVEVIEDIFTFDINDKKIINLLYKNIKNYCRDYLKEELSSIKDKIDGLINNVSIDYDLEIMATKEIKEEELFKAVELKIDDNSNNKIERIIKYIRILYELKGTNVFFVFRFHEFFEKDEIETIFNELKYYNISIVNIESRQPIEKLPFESFVILDNDLSLIM